MTRFRVIIEPPAADDIAAYASWILAQGAPENAARWIDRIQDAIETLGTMAEQCALAPESVDFGREIRELFFKSHRILFVVERASVHVIHVRHGARDTAAPDELERDR